MIQELISTSSPRCLDGNAGFGVVAQTAGMVPNVAREVGVLSGYSHLFPAGDPRNPVVFLHAIRRGGGVDRHIISRVADCGNDYSGRTNRIAHHWIAETPDLLSVPCGPLAIVSQQGMFRTEWNEKSQELPRGKTLQNSQVTATICHNWQRWCGDAGWGGVVAERIERGDPISLIFEPGMDVLPLLAEVFALLPTSVRWKTTFSTFFIKSQEPPNTPPIQVKCIAAGSSEKAFARQTPNTLLIDLRKPPSVKPSGKYVERARTGVDTKTSIPKPPKVSVPGHAEHPAPGVNVPYDNEEIYDLVPYQTPVPIAKPRTVSIPKPKKAKKTWLKSKWFIPSLVIIGVLIVSILVIGIILLGLFAASIKAENLEKLRIATVNATDKKEVAIGKVKTIYTAAIEAQKKAEETRNKVEAANTTIEKAVKEIEEVERKDTSSEMATCANDAEKLTGQANDVREEANIATKGAKNELLSKAGSNAINDAEEAINEWQGAKAELKAEQKRQKGDIAEEKTEYFEVEVADGKTVAIKEVEEEVKKAEDIIAQTESAATELSGKISEMENRIRETYDAIDKKLIEEKKAAEKKRIQDALENLPKFWNGIALSESGNEEGYLDNSDFLWGIKEHVKIDLDESFVKLNALLHEFESITKNDKSDPHTITFSATRKGETNPDEIVALSLNGGGLFYKWNQKVLDEKYNSTDCRREINRICLSKLRIEVENKNIELKEKVSVSLWMPAVYTATEFESTRDKDGYFFLWKEDEKRKEFVVDSMNEEWLLLDFDELILGDGTLELTDKEYVKEKNRSFAYAPIISKGASKAYYYIPIPEQERKDLKIKMDFVSKIVESGTEELDGITKEGRKFLNDLDSLKNGSREFRRGNSLPTTVATGKLREKDFENIKKTPFLQEDEISPDDNIDFLEKEKKSLPRDDPRVKEIDTEIKVWKKKKEFNAMQEKIEKEKETWKNLQVKHFTIDLVKPGTKPAEVAESVRLRLFQVTDD